MGVSWGGGCGPLETAWSVLATGVSTGYCDIRTPLWGGGGVRVSWVFAGGRLIVLGRGAVNLRSGCRSWVVVDVADRSVRYSPALLSGNGC